jgi:hypothetical protein
MELVWFRLALLSWGDEGIPAFATVSSAWAGIFSRLLRFAASLLGLFVEVVDGLAYGLA